MQYYHIRDTLGIIKSICRETLAPLSPLPQTRSIHECSRPARSPLQCRTRAENWKKNACLSKQSSAMTLQKLPGFWMMNSPLTGAPYTNLPLWYAVHADNLPAARTSFSEEKGESQNEWFFDEPPELVYQIHCALLSGMLSWVGALLEVGADIHARTSVCCRPGCAWRSVRDDGCRRFIQYQSSAREREL
jgi:hypothetical protein